MGLLFGVILPLAAFFYILYYAVLPVKTVKFEKRSVPVSKSKKKGETHIYRSYKFKDKLLTEPTESDTEGQKVKTLADLVENAKNRFGSKHALGQRVTIKHSTKKQKEKDKDGKEHEKTLTIPWQTDYKWITYNQLYDEVVKLGYGLVGSSIQAVEQKLSGSQGNGAKQLKAGVKIGLYASTRPEWLITAHAAFQHNLIVATCYPSLGPDALDYVLNQCEVNVIVTEAKLLATQLYKALEKLKHVHTVVYMDSYDPDEKYAKQIKETAEKWKGKVQLLPYSKVKQLGEKYEEQVTKWQEKPKPEDLAVIMYTSGSTGNPKGVMIKHSNVIAEIYGVQSLLPDYITKNDTYIAFLPLAHIFELACEMANFYVGARIGYSSPITLRSDQVKDENGEGAGDLQVLKPTAMSFVPAVAERLQSGINQVLQKQGIIAMTLFKIAFYFKRRNFLRGQSSPVWDKLIFDKIADKFGGKLRYMLSGGAPLSPKTQMFITLCFKAPVLQGYGLTETTAAGTITIPQDVEFGSVGGAVPCLEIKLIDCPDMGYTSDDKPYPRGEICIRGPNVTAGYYQMEDKTKEDFRDSDDGSPYKWFHTGDVGQIDDDGRLSVIDRKKDLVKLRHGEYIALGKIESYLQESKFVDNVCLHGNGSIDNPVALVVVNQEEIKSVGSGGDVEKMLDDDTVKKHVLDDMKQYGQKHNCHKSEIPSYCKLLTEPWTPDSGLVTEAMKLKRSPIEKKFSKELEELYEKAGGKFKDN